MAYKNLVTINDTSFQAKAILAIGKVNRINSISDWSFMVYCLNNFAVTIEPTSKYLKDFDPDKFKEGDIEQIVKDIRQKAISDWDQALSN